MGRLPTKEEATACSRYIPLEPDASVSQEPEKDFIFPTGRPWAEDLGYPEELANVPDTAVGSFAGVANPWQLGRLAPGERVLDLGSGAGTDSLVAAQMVGEHGHVTGIDMTPEMLAKARADACPITPCLNCALPPAAAPSGNAAGSVGLNCDET
jgi:SAM-dependent methyltransferase